MIDKQTEHNRVDNIPEDLRDSRGFLVYFPHDLHGYAKLYGDLSLRSNLKEFLIDIIALMAGKAEYCSFDQITDHLIQQGKPSGKTMIYDRVKKLTEAGLMVEAFFRKTQGARRVKILTMKPPIIDTAAINPEYLERKSVPNGNKNKTQEADTKLELLKTQFEDQMLSEISNRSYRDMIMSAMLSKCIRLDSRDDRKKLVTNFSYKDDPIDVTTTTLTDGNIAISSDIRYTMVITTFCLEIMGNFITKYKDPTKKPENLFVIDLSEVCTHIGNKRTTGNRLTAYRAIKRLFQTNFEIKTPQESEFAQQFLEGYNEANYRFLTDFQAMVQELTESDDLFTDEEDDEIDDGQIANPRWVRISLWPSSFENMWNQAIARYEAQTSKDALSSQPVLNFIQNPAVVKNKAPLTYQLYSHLSSWVGVSGYEKKECTTSDLHFYMLRTSRYQNFVRSLLKVFHSIQEPSEAPITIDTPSFRLNLYGYFIEGSAITLENKRKGFLLTFYRDREDKYIGDRSRHHQLKRSQQAAVEGTGDTPTETDTNEPTGGEYSEYARFSKLQGELGKNPDDPTIPKGQLIKTRSDGGWDLEPYELFDGEEPANH